MGIIVDTARLEGTAPTLTQKSGQAGNLISDIQSATSQAASALEAASIGGLGNVGGTLQNLGGRIGTSLECFSKALQQTGQGLINAGQAFAHNDAQLMSMFQQLQKEFQPPVAPRPTPQKKPGHHHSFWGATGLLVGGGTLAIVGGFFEPETVGLDTPVTVGGAAMATEGAQALWALAA